MGTAQDNPSEPSTEVSSADVTRVLDQINRGDAGASDRLLPLVYEELRRLARPPWHENRRGRRRSPRLWFTRLMYGS